MTTDNALPRRKRIKSWRGLSEGSILICTDPSGYWACTGECRDYTGTCGSPGDGHVDCQLRVMEFGQTGVVIEKYTIGGNGLRMIVFSRDALLHLNFFSRDHGIQQVVLDRV